MCVTPGPVKVADISSQHQTIYDSTDRTHRATTFDLHHRIRSEDNEGRQQASALSCASLPFWPTGLLLFNQCLRLRDTKEPRMLSAIGCVPWRNLTVSCGYFLTVSS
jgi:hypothetical protein